MRGAVLTMFVLLSSPVFASAPIDPAPEKPAKVKKITLDPVTVDSSVKAMPIIIPRAGAAKKDVNSASEHLLDATQRR